MVRRVVLASVFSVLCLLSCDRSTHHQEVFFEGERVSIPLDAGISGKPRFFYVSLRDTKVRFFIIRLNDEPQSFFDACLSCYQRKRGFREDEGVMICQSCGVKYPTGDLRTGIGGCYAIRLAGAVEDGRYTIAKEALREGLKYF